MKKKELLKRIEKLENASCLNVLVSSGLVNSRSEGRRMVMQKAIKHNGIVISNCDAKVLSGILQVGKRKIVL